jgi:dihydroxy-acid dehydratase
MHINKLAEEAGNGGDISGAKSVFYNTITMSDGISMGTEGMKYSLVSREMICDSIEAVSTGMRHDGIIEIGGCDKNMSGCLMGLAHLNRSSIFVYGGTIMPVEDHTDIVSVFESVGSYANGDVPITQLDHIEKQRFPDQALAVACLRQTH